MKTKFITFYYDYTDSKYYENSKNQIKNQIENLGGNLLAYNPILSEDYRINCLYKPRYILNKLLELQENIIWIDVDCFVRKLPLEFDNISEDIGFVLRADNKTPHSALIYFSYNDNVIEFIKEWITNSEKQIENVKNNTFNGTDHNILVDMFLQNKNNLKYKLFDYTMASTNYLNSNVIIGISPGGWEVERRKNV